MSQLEDRLLHHMRAVGVPEPEREYRFAKPRRWAFDFCWPDRMLAVEVEGGIWSGGRHITGAGFMRDADKYNQATLLGWRVLRFAVNHIDSGEAITTIERALREERDS